MSLAMTKEEREGFLGDVHVGIVSIPRGDRAPLTVPIWYDYEPGGDVWMLTGRSSLKAKALSKASRLSFCVQSERPPYSYVSIEGPFRTRAVEPGELLHMALRYLGDEQGRAYAESAGSEEDNVVVCISPETWLSVASACRLASDTKSCPCFPNRQHRQSSCRWHR